VPGEVCVGGDGLARGYLHRPEITAETFIANPFSTKPGARLYRTGDLARHLADGNIEFLGRIDHQVKVRGYRIELGEIEFVLAQHPAVREAVVLAREDDVAGFSASRPEGKRLVAYVVVRQGAAPTINEVRSFLKEKLPEYMIPSAFVFVAALPLTANGKIDRKALPAPDQRRPEGQEGHAAPRTHVEEVIAEIWAGVLNLDKVGIQDNFFELGGHSLLATQVISRLCDVFKVDIPLRAFFDSPTVAGLAERIEETGRKEQGVETLPPVTVSREQALPLSFAQQRLWFLDQLEPGSTVYNLSGAWRLRGSLNVAALERSLYEIIRRHEALRTTFSIVEDKPVQVITSSVTLALSVIDLTERLEEERERDARRILGEDSRRAFDLARGPLFRACLIRLGEQHHELLLTMHHIVSDGWSMAVLNRELSALYRAFCQSEPYPLAKLPMQYAEYAAWQRKWLQGEILRDQLSYWKTQLDGIPAVLNLPTDRPWTTVESFRGRRQSIELSKELTQELKRLSRMEGVTLFMTLLAAFQTLLYRYSGQEDIVVGSPIANRNRSEIECLIGFFVNTLVLRSNFSGNPTFTELLSRVKETTLGAYAHQDLPFEKLVEEIQPERSVNRTPLFRVLFNMTNQEDANLDLLGLTVEHISYCEPESKFDLTLYVKEENGQIKCDLVYRLDLFEPSLMTCFLQQYKYVLVQIVAGPERPIGSYSLVTPESRLLLPDPAVILDSPPQQLLTRTFFSWAEQMPAHAAVCQGQQTWTYDELSQCAGTLARRIVTSGLAPREVVAVHGQPSFGLVAAMIATFLSGGVLLLLDRTLPIERKQRMLREAKAKRLLYVGATQPDITWLEEGFATGIRIDPRNGCAIETESKKDLQPTGLPEVHPDDPAYVFFTSGSTGVPKGVLGCHKGLSHFLSWQRETFAIRPNDRVAQLTALSFDAVLRDIFLPLTSGATLCLPDADDARGSGETIDWLERQQITVLHAVPSLAHSWLTAESTQHRLGNLRWVFFMGEPLTGAFVRLWRSITHHSAKIVNLYGPTETTLIKCFYRLPDETSPG
ncbi:MAG TPA: condensation domain-containing protein, partial [Candidatus Binatia bacterium]|nr:condensation domain-containing protein [Candidatus Binatia bacterium]